jgi:Fe2+ transport system protein FeoA
MNKFYNLKRLDILFYIISAVFYFVFGGHTQAQTWYVDVNNTQPGTGNGTQQNPFKSIKNAIQAVNASSFTGWKTIFIAPGVYTGTDNRNMEITVPRVRIIGDTTSSGAGAGSNAPIIDGQGLNAYCFGANPLNTGGKIRIEGLYIKDFGSSFSPVGMGVNTTLSTIPNSNANGTGFVMNSSMNLPADSVIIRRNTFENLLYSIFIGAGNPSGGARTYEHIDISYNRITMNNLNRVGIHLQNAKNSRISWNEILGTPSNSGEYGIEIMLNHFSSAVIGENININNNKFEFNRHSNLLITSRTNNANGALRHIFIRNNFFRNSNQFTSSTVPSVTIYNTTGGFGGRLIRVSPNGNTPNVNFTNIQISDLVVENNTFEFHITNGSIPGIAPSNPPLGYSWFNWGCLFYNVLGSNLFQRNQFQYVGNPVVTSTGDFHSVGLEYNNANQTGSWNIMQNNFTGPGINAAFNVAAAVHIEELQGPQNIMIAENFITNYRNAIRVGTIPGTTKIQPTEIENIRIRSNNLGGNRVGVINNSFFVNPAPNNDNQGILNASGNWWGDNDPTNIANYVDGLQNVATGSCNPFSFTISPLTPADLNFFNFPNVDYTPWLQTAADIDNNPSTGFQGDFSYLNVDRFSPQFPGTAGLFCPGPVTDAPLNARLGGLGRINEACSLVVDNGTIFIHDRGNVYYYNEGDQNTVVRNTKFASNGFPKMDNLYMNTSNSNQKLTLLTSFRIFNSLNLLKGKIDLGNFNINIPCDLVPPNQPAISIGNDSSYVITSNQGKFIWECVGGAGGYQNALNYPIGTITAHAPATIKNNQTSPNHYPDKIGMRVRDEVFDPPTATTNPRKDVVRFTWFIDEGCTAAACTGPNCPPLVACNVNSVPDNVLTIKLQWKENNEGTAFNREQSRMRYYDASANPPGWQDMPASPAGPPLGGNPYQKQTASFNFTLPLSDRAFAVFSDCPEIPSAQDVILCQPGVVTFTASMGTPPGQIMRLYSVPSGGIPIFENNTPLSTLPPQTYLLPTPPLNGTQDFYIASVFNQANGGCESRRIKVKASAVGSPGKPVMPQVQRCGPGPVTITALLGNPPGNEVRLYNDASATSLIATDNTPPYTFTIPSVVTTTTFYLKVFTVNQFGNCESPVDSVAAVIHPIPSSPILSTLQRCGAGASTFTVSMSTPPGTEIRMYTQPSGGTPFATDDTSPYEFTTPSVTTTTTYYFSVFNGVTNCESARVPAAININAQIGNPTAVDFTRCGSGPVTLTAQMGFPAGDEIRLYNAPSGGSLLVSVPAPLTIPLNNVATTSTYYVSAYNNITSCESGRTPVTVTIASVPANPTANDALRCGPGQVTFSINMGTPSGSEVRLYNTQTGGFPIAIDNAAPFELTTPSITTTTIFFIESAIANCISARTPINAIIGSSVGQPTVNNVVRCQAGSVTFTAVIGSAGDEIRVWDAQTGGNLLASKDAPPYTFTFNVTTTSTFYFSTVNSQNNCFSPRVAAVAEITPTLSPPLVNNVARCGTGPVTVTATMGEVAGDVMRLYLTPTGGTPVAIDNVPPFEFTQTVSGNVTWYVESFSSTSGCASPTRSPVFVTINQAPGQPSAQPVARCDFGPVTFTAMMGSPLGSEIRLYTSATAAFPIETASSSPFLLTTAVLTTTANFFIASFNAQTGCESNRTQVTALAIPSPSAPVATNASRCGTGAVTLTAQMGLIPGASMRMYLTPTGSAPFAEANAAPYTFLTPQINTNTTFFLESVTSIPGTTCVSSKTPVSVQINTSPLVPQSISISRCEAGSVVLSPNIGTTGGNEARLYALQQGGTPLATATAFPFTLTTPSVSTTTTFYLSSFNSSTGCESGRSGVEVVINSAPGAPSATPVARCQAGTLTITVTMGFPAGNQILLYNQSIGGNPIAADNVPPYELITPTLFTTTTLFIESVNTQTNCRSPRVPVTATINSVAPGVPSAAGVQRCGSGSVTFTANMGFPAGNSIRLYTTSTAANPAATVSSQPYILPTPAITTTTTFFISSFDSFTGCESGRQSVIATVTPAPGAPSAPDVTRCGPGLLTFTASMGSPGGNEIRLYDSPTGTNPLALAVIPPYTLPLPFLSATATYFLASFSSSTNCESVRVPVIATIHPLPGAPTASNVTVCSSGGSVTITANMGNPAGSEIRLYTVSSGGTPESVAASEPYILFSPPVGGATAFFLESANLVTGCTSAVRTAVQVNVITTPPPGVPTINNVTRCGQGNVTFTAIMGNPAGVSIRLYSDLQGNNIIASASQAPFLLTTPSLTTTTTFYAASVSSQGCELTRVAVVASINSIPSAPTGVSAPRCGNGSVIITAQMGLVPGSEIRLFTTASGGQPVAVDNTFPYELSTPEVFTSTRFFLESASPISNCVSQRFPITVLVNPNPSAPLAANLSRCGAGPVTITPQSGAVAADEMRLFLSPNGGTPIATDNSEPFELTIPNVATTSTYFIEPINNTTGCVGTRSSFTVTVHQLPGAPASSNVTRCGSGFVTFSVTMGVPQGNQVRLYDTETGGTLITSDFTLPYELPAFIGATTTFYIASFSSQTGCESNRLPVVGFINNTLEAPTAGSVSRCGSGPVTLTAQNVSPEANIVRVFNTPIGGTLLGSSSSFPYVITTSFLPTSSILYLESANTTTGCTSPRSAVTVSVQPIPGIPSASASVARCGPGRLTITAFMATPEGSEIRLYDSSSGGIPLFSSSASPYLLVTPEINTSTIYYISAINTFSGCESNRLPISANINAIPGAPEVFGTSRCGNGSLTLSALMGTPAGTELRLYNTQFGGQPILIDNSSPFEFNTGFLASTTTFFVESANLLTSPSCVSSRVQVVATINGLPPAPIAQNVSRCGSGVATITVSSNTTANIRAQLFTEQIGGGAIAEDAIPPYELSSPFTSNSTNLFVGLFNGLTGCASERVPVAVTILPLPSEPSVMNTSRCGGGRVTFTANLFGNTSGMEIRVYSTATGGSPLASDSAPIYELSVNSVSTNTTFYFETVNLNTGCVSPRITAAANINPSPSIPAVNSSVLSRCGQGAVTFSATMGQIPGTEMRLYDAEVAGNLVAVDNTFPFELRTPVLPFTNSYFLESINTLTGCASGRVRVTAEVTAGPSIPSASAVSRCGSGPITLTAFMGANPGQEMRLYLQQVGGSPILVDNNFPFAFSIPFVANSVTYFIASANSNCESERIPVAVTVNLTPSQPFAVAPSICGAGSATITAQMTEIPGSIMRLYNAQQGGSLVASATSNPYILTIPSISATATYYLASANANCESNRTPVVISVLPKPLAPFAASSSVCGSGPVTFSVRNFDNLSLTYRLYNSPNGVGALVPPVTGNAVTLTTPVINTTTTFYISASQNECESELTPVLARVLVAPSRPSASNLTVCAASAAVITAMMGVTPGAEIRLFDSPSGGSLLGSASFSPYLLTVPALSGVTTYYIESALGDCQSERVPVTVTLVNKPGTPLVSRVTRCGEGPIVFSPNVGANPGAAVRLYDSNGTLLDEDISFPYTLTAANVRTNSLFFISSIIGTCESERVSVVGAIAPQPSDPIIRTVARCGGGTVTLTALMGQSAGESIRWYDANLNLLSSSFTPPYTYSLTASSNTTIFVASAIGACESAKVLAPINIIEVPSMPLVSDVTRCNAGVLTFTVTMGGIPGTEIRFYDSPIGGNIAAASANNPALVTFSLNQSVTYYVSAARLSNNVVCESPRRQVVGAVASIPAAPVANDASRCGSGVVTFSPVMSSPAGSEFRLYTVTTGGSPISISSANPGALVTPSLNAAEFYFIAAANGNCESPRVSVTANIVQSPSTPASQNFSRCGAGVVTLTAANGISPGNEFRVYNQPVGGDLVFRGGTPFIFTTPRLTSNTTYYLSSAIVSGTTVCESSRLAIAVSVNSVPGVPSIFNTGEITRCGNGPITITGIMGTPSGTSLRIYDSPNASIPIVSGNTSPYILTINNATLNTSYYLASAIGSCESERVGLPIRVINPPSTPFAANLNFCGSGGAVITAQMSERPGTEIRLYEQPFGGAPISVDNSAPYHLVTQPINATATYYLSSANGGCESSRAAVIVNVNNSGQALSPQALNVSRCGEGPVTFTVTNIANGTQISLFDGQGNLISQRSSEPYQLTVPRLTSTSEYFVQASNGVCSSSRVAVSGILTNELGQPSDVRGFICGAGNLATISATMGSPAGMELRVYDAPNGGTLLATAQEPFIAQVRGASSGATYFVASGSGACESPRVPVSISAGATNPSDPTLTSSASCGSSSVTVTALMGAIAGTEIRMYASAVGGSPISVRRAAPFVFELNANPPATYYFTSASGGCESNRVPFAVSSTGVTPSQPTVSASGGCGVGGSVTFTASFGATPGTEFRVYAQQSGGSPLVTSANNVFSLNNSDLSTFFVAAASGACESPRTPVNVNRGTSLLISSSSVAESCASGGRITSSVSGGVNPLQYRLISNGNVIATNSTGQFSDLRAGTYTITVSDGAGCSAQSVSTVTGFSGPEITNISSVTESGATISWSPLNDANGYVLEYRRRGESDFITIADISGTSNTRTISGLSPNTDYEVRLRAVCSGGRQSANSNIQNFRTSLGSGGGCVTPQSIRITQQSGGALVSWSAVAGALGYNLRYRLLPNGSFLSAPNIISTSFSLLDLAAGSSYEIQVQTICSGGSLSDFSAPQSFTVSGGSQNCGVPQNVRASASALQATIAWNAVAGATAYELRYRLLPNGSFITFANITGTTQAIAGLQTGNTYEAQVRALCGAQGSSDFSTSVQFMAQDQDGGICQTPTNIQVTNISPSVVNVSWLPNASGASCYIVSYGPANTNTSGWPQQLVPHPGSSLQITNLQPGQEYQVRIRTNCSLCSFQNGILTPYSSPVNFRTLSGKVFEIRASLLEAELYPNPTTGIFNLAVRAESGAEIKSELLDINGKVVIQQLGKAENGRLEVIFDIQAFPSGIYLLKVSDGKVIQNIKVVKR